MKTTSFRLWRINGSTAKIERTSLRLRDFPQDIRSQFSHRQNDLSNIGSQRSLKKFPTPKMKITRRQRERFSIELLPTGCEPGKLLACISAGVWTRRL